MKARILISFLFLSTMIMSCDDASSGDNTLDADLDPGLLSFLNWDNSHLDENNWN